MSDSAQDRIAASTIEFVDESGRDLGAPLFEQAVRRALHERPGGLSAPCEVAVLWTDDDGIAELHGRFLDDPTETDVMSFETDEHSIDVVVNVARAERESERRGVDRDAELTLYVVHGVLHCLGYDDHDDEERRAMRDAETRVLQALGLQHAPVDDEH